MSKSDYLEQKLQDHTLARATYTSPTGIYVSLHTADPGETGTSEVSGNAYARVAAGVGSGNWNRTASVASNANALTFTAPTPSTWGTVTHFGLWDAVSGGNFLGGGALTVSRATAVGVALSFAVGDLTWTED